MRRWGRSADGCDAAYGRDAAGADAGAVARAPRAIAGGVVIGLAPLRAVSRRSRGRALGVHLGGVGYMPVAVGGGANGAAVDRRWETGPPEAPRGWPRTRRGPSGLRLGGPTDVGAPPAPDASGALDANGLRFCDAPPTCGLSGACEANGFGIVASSRAARWSSGPRADSSTRP